MSDPNSTPAESGRTQIDTEHQKGEVARDNRRPQAQKDPLAHNLPGAVPGNTGIDDVNTRMMPRSNGAGETGVEGRSSEGASGGAGIPGGTAPNDDTRKEKRV